LKLPVFDASKEGFRIQDSVVRILEKPRRQNRVVGDAIAAAKLEASESGSWLSASRDAFVLDDAWQSGIMSVVLLSEIS
jgi:hypothetical protein